MGVTIFTHWVTHFWILQMFGTHLWCLNKCCPHHSNVVLFVLRSLYSYFPPPLYQSPNFNKFQLAAISSRSHKLLLFAVMVLGVPFKIEPLLYGNYKKKKNQNFLVRSATKKIRSNWVNYWCKELYSLLLHRIVFGDQHSPVCLHHVMACWIDIVTCQTMAYSQRISNISVFLKPSQAVQSIRCRILSLVWLILYSGVCHKRIEVSGNVYQNQISLNSWCTRL